MKDLRTKEVVNEAEKAWASELWETSVEAVQRVTGDPTTIAWSYSKQR